MRQGVPQLARRHVQRPAHVDRCARHLVVDPVDLGDRGHRSDRVAELGLDVAKYSAWTRVVCSLLAVCSQRDTSGSVDAMTLFCAGAGTPGEWPERAKRWMPFVRRLRPVMVNGSHFTLMGPQHVANFQAILRAEIDAAFEQEAMTS